MCRPGHIFDSISRFILLTGVVCSIAACSSTDVCQEDFTGTALNVALYRTVYDDNTESYIVESYSLPMTVSGLDSDSILYDSTVTATLSLPLSMHDSVSTFSLESHLSIDDTTTIARVDTLSIFHTNTLTLVSLECGCTTDFTVDNAASTVHAIDSCVIENKEVSYLTTNNNLRIYLRNR